MENIEIYVIAIATLGATLRLATPLLLAALGGMFAERSGVMNIALEGTILFGAFTAVVVSYFTKLPWLGVLGAALVGGLVATLLAWLSVDVRANQVVSGTALNMLAIGITSYLITIIWGRPGHSPMVESIGLVRVPIMVDIPVIGQLFNSLSLLTYLALLLVPVSHLLLFRTPWGLWIRSVGEHPRAADTVGINVRKIRYLSVIVSGILSGIAGAYLSVAHTSSFVKLMSDGRGFIALGTMIFGRWRPYGIFWACLLFGFADALQWVLQITNISVPSQLLLALPYIMTIIALSVFVVQSIGPAAVGKPYEA